MAAAFPFTGPVKCNRMTSFSNLLFSLTSNSCNISLPKNVHVYDNSFSLFLKQSSIHRNLYSLRQRGISPVAFEAKNSESAGSGSGEGRGDNQALVAVLKLYYAIKNRNTHDLSELFADECPCVCNFLSFFQAFQGEKQVLDFLSYLIRTIGNNIQIVVKPTLPDGMNVSVQWRFGWDKIHVPLWKGSSFNIYQIYKGKAEIRNVEMFMEPLLHFEPLRLFVKTGSFMGSEKKNNPKRILLASSFIVALLFFVKLASCNAML